MAAGDNPNQSASGHWRTLLDSDVLRYVDLRGGEYTLTIKAVRKGKVTGANGKSSGKAMIYFDGRGADGQDRKPLAAGAAVLSVIAGLYGPDVRDWIGKAITIYADPTVTYGGAQVGGIRVRPVVPGREDPK